MKDGPAVLNPPLELMRPEATRRVPAVRGGLLWQLKADGWRCACFVDEQGAVQLQTRSKRLVADRFPELVPSLGDCLPPGTVLDGELVAFRGENLDIFALPMTASRRREEKIGIGYLAFDVLYAGEDLRGRPLSERWSTLLELVPERRGKPRPLQVISATLSREEAQLWSGAMAGHGFEGLVAKRLTSTYGPGTGKWWKIRHADTEDGELVEVAGTGPRPRVRVRLDDGSTVVTEPLTRAQIEQLLEALTELPDGGGLRVEVRVGVGRHGVSEFVRPRLEQ